jgi:hypothetical protein
MSGKGDLVYFTSITATTEAQRKDLKKQIDTIIGAATGTITVQALVQAFSEDIIKDMLEKIRKLEKPKL